MKGTLIIRSEHILRNFLDSTKDKGVGGLGDGSPPAGSRGRAPVGGLGDEVPQKLKSYYKFAANFQGLFYNKCEFD